MDTVLTEKLTKSPPSTQETLPESFGEPSKWVKRVTPELAIAICTLVEKKRLTEHEACIRLNLKPNTWYSWKSRGKNTARTASICARVRGATIEHAINRIEEAGKRDWRADLARLSLIDPARFAPHQQSTTTTNNTLVIAGDSERIKQLCAVFAAPALPPGQGQAKLPAGTTDQPADQPIEA